MGGLLLFYEMLESSGNIWEYTRNIPNIMGRLGILWTDWEYHGVLCE
jgi:hypothetical protein